MTHAYAPGEEHDDSVHHEEADIDIRAIFMAVVALTVMTAFCYLVVWASFKMVEGTPTEQSVRYPLALGQETGQPPVSDGRTAAFLPFQWALGKERRLPPLPRLQTVPKKDLADLRASETSALENYRWLDRNGGIVRVPIAEAMKLTVQRGLASRQGGSAEAAPVQ
jgi:hypothetical protein